MPRTVRKVRVPKGFDYEEARQAHWQKLPQPEINRHCIESAEESLEQYQDFERYYFDQEKGSLSIRRFRFTTTFLRNQLRIGIRLRT